MFKYLVGVAVLVGIVMVVVLNPFTTIGTGERGVVLDFGAFNGQVLTPGLHWVTPIKQDVVSVNVQTQKEETQVAAASKDLQSVSTTVALNYHLDPSKVGNIYQKIGLEYSSRIISPAMQEAVKAVTARFTAEELITRRQEVKEQIKALLLERLATEYIMVEEFAVVNFDFSESFNAAIEAKVTAEQQALAARNKLEQVKFEAQQKIETAKADAEMIKIQAAAVSAQGGEDFVKLQWIEAWKAGGSKVPNTLIGEGAQNFLLNLQ